MTVKLKVYELAKQLGIDNQYLLEICKRLGVDTKNSMSVLGSEEVKSVREFYEKHRAINKKDAILTGKGPVTESRVGGKVIRRRVAAKGEEAAAPEETPAPVEVEAAPEPESIEEPVVTAGAPVEDEAPEPVIPEKVVAAPAAPAAKKPLEHKPIVKRTRIEEVMPPPPRPRKADSKPAPVVVTAPVISAPLTAALPTTPGTIEAPKRRTFPSIIKKSSVESHLTSTVGPKREAPPKRPAAPLTAKKPGTEEDAGGLRRVKEVTMGPVATEVANVANKRRTGQQNTVFRSADYLKRELVHATKKRKTASRPAQKTMITVPGDKKRVIDMGEKIKVSDFAHQLGIKGTQLIKKLMEMGVQASLNEAIDHDTAILVAHEFKFEVKQEMFKEETFIPKVQLADENLSPRGPVVTIMGHVDHGKTSLLDSIRKANVASGEAGGITQHIGAYSVVLPKKGTITFIDTPGHEAFTAMRARGAKVTDIVVLVVSAVDGVMPQTLESIAHAKAGNVPIVVAVNKTDLPDANPDRIKQVLAGHDLAPEDWGGTTIYVSVSAKTGKGIPELLDSILVQAEVLELKANFTCPARGTVIESKMDRNRGSLATVLVQQGTLRLGDLVVAGTAVGKVRAMNDAYGKPLKEAGPSTPVEILGLSDAAPVGEEMAVVEDDRTARTIIEARTDKARSETVLDRPKMTLEEMMAVGTTGTKELRLILKSDVVGSLEAIKVALSKIPDDKVKLKILHTATGGISESDVNLAMASRAAILGFNVKPDNNARRKAEADKVELRTYTIIYEIVDDVKNLMEGLLDRLIKETVIGHAEVRNVFTIPKIGTIAGSAVTDGKVTRGCFLRLVRDSRVVYEGKVSSLRRFKDDVKEVSTGYECGIGVENFNDVKTGDRFEAFVKEEVKSSL